MDLARLSQKPKLKTPMKAKRDLLPRSLYIQSFIDTGRLLSHFAKLDDLAQYEIYEVLGFSVNSGKFGRQLYIKVYLKGKLLTIPLPKKYLELFDAIPSDVDKFAELDQLKFFIFGGRSGEKGNAPYLYFSVTKEEAIEDLELIRAAANIVSDDEQ